MAFAGLAAGPATARSAGSRQTPEPPAAGGVGVRLLDAPVATKDDPRARSYIVDHIAPGTVISRRVEVSNTTTGSAGVVLYAAAASITDGQFVGAADRTPNDLTTWTSVTPGQFDIPAGGTATATATITVPADAAPGEQYGVIWVESRSAPPSGTGVTQVSRVGIRLYVSVGPGGAPAADFEITELTARRTAEGLPLLLAKVRNSGGRALDMGGDLKLSAGPGGLAAGPFPAELGTSLAIGDTQPISITLDDQLPAGPWDAMITLRSGLIERTASAQITFPAAGEARTVVPAEEEGGQDWLLPALGGLALLALAATALWFALRRPRKASAGRSADDEVREPVHTS